jgi:hypothetical protein
VIRLAVCTALAVLAVVGAVALFGLALVATRPFPDEHDGVED